MAHAASPDRSLSRCPSKDMTIAPSTVLRRAISATRRSISRRGDVEPLGVGGRARSLPPIPPFVTAGRSSRV